MSNFGDFSGFEAMFGDASTAANSAVQAAAPAPAVVPASAPAAPAPANVAASGAITTISDDFEIGLPADLQQSMEEMGVVVGDIGTKISKVPIEKYKASTAKVDRISFLTKKVIAIKFHYVQDIGSIVCFGGKCCELGGAPNVRYLFPIAVYSTDSEGNVTGSKVEMRILAAGEDLYKSIMTINKGTAQYGGIDHADLLVTCTDDKFQKISLTFAGPAMWRKSAKVAQFLNDRWMKDGTNAYMAIARKCDEASFMKLLGMAEDSSDDSRGYASAQNADLSKFFDED